MDFTEASSDAGEVVDAKPTSPVSSPATLSVPPRNTANCFTKTLNSSATPRDSVSRGFTGSESFSRLLAAAMLVESLDNPAFTMSTSQSSVPVAPLLVERDDANTDSGENISPGAARSSIAKFMTNRPVGLPVSQSPILLSTEQAEPSPATGGLSLPLYIYPSGLSCVSALNNFEDQMPDGGTSFIFKPIASLGNNHWSTLINLGPLGVSHQQALEQVEAHAQAQAQLLSLHPGNIVTFATTTGSDCSYDAAKFVSPAQIRDLPECTSQALVESSMQAQDLQPLAHQPYLVETSSEDDYNWRKYGQKQLKCGEYPRSYYKCTYPSCLVKKRVERSLDGQVMKIVYKGEHNHVKPNSNYRVSADAAYMLDGSGREVKGLNACIKADQSNEAHNLNTETELTSAFSDPSLSRANGTPDPSSVSICVDDAAHSKINDGHNEPDSKRRKKEKANEKAPLALIRTIPEPRIVVQTTNEADILDDGHRWRKYGQKIVKGSPHPRSYYRCTNLGCLVRKHVERSATDPKAVILTYEGKHNHDMHAAQSGSKNFTGNSKPVTNSVAKRSLS